MLHNKISTDKLVIVSVCLLALLSGRVLFAAATRFGLQISPPSPPSDLAAAVVSSSEIDLSWSAAAGIVGYKVYRDGVLIASLTGISYQDTGLSPATSYSYTVSSVDAVGNESAQSSAVSAATAIVMLVLGGGGGGGGGGGITPTPTTPGPLGPEAAKVDANKDNKIDVLDFNTLMVNWEITGAGNPADFNGDGTVDILDFNLLMVYWAP